MLQQTEQFTRTTLAYEGHHSMLLIILNGALSALVLTLRYGFVDKCCILFDKNRQNMCNHARIVQ